MVGAVQFDDDFSLTKKGGHFWIYPLFSNVTAEMSIYCILKVKL